jgi:PKD repeat protein
VAVQAASWLPPVAVATADATSGPAPLTVCFDAGGSSSPQPGALTFAWTFGDGGSAGTAQACHTYGIASPSPYSAAVTVTDVRGFTDSELFSITVTEPNRPPVASPTATPNRGAAPLAVRFTAGASDPDGDPLTFAWNFGDPSSPDNTSALPDPTHLYRHGGTFTAWLTVSDGQVSIVRSLTISVDASISLEVRFARVKWWKKSVTGSATLWADFQAPLPAPDDLVMVSFDGVALLAEPFSAFRRDRWSGAWLLARRGLVARLDFARGRLFLLTPKIGLAGLDPSNGVDVELVLGSSVAIENIRMAPAGRELLLYRRDGCDGEDDE